MSERTVLRPEREIPVAAEVDVLVVGGGTAGMPAAVAAARNGARTALVERYGYVGGAAVGGLVVTVPEAAGVWGIEREFYSQLEPLGGVVRGNVTADPWFIVSAPLCKCLGDTFLRAAGVELFYHSLLSGVTMDRDRLAAAIIETKSGPLAIRAKMFVDATGDADLAALAGVPWEKGDAQGRMSPVTAMYMLANVDLEKYEAERKPGEPIPQPRAYFVPTAVHPGEVNCWGGSVEGDGTDVRDLTRLEIQLRARILEETENMRRVVPGFERAYISVLAEQMGVRETRRITGRTRVTIEDVKAQRIFPDSIGRAWEFTIPYGALVPKNVENLLVAGRCICTDSQAHGKARIVPACFTTGQAAGAAAAMAARDASPAGSVPVGKLQDVLRAQHVDLGL